MTIKHSYPSAWPTVNFDFANGQSLDPRITHTRDSIGTYFDENGILQYAAEGEPRFDYDPETGESLGLLIEESKTNIAEQSEDLDTWWTKLNITFDPNATQAPDGLSQADKMVSPDRSDRFSIYKQLALTADRTYTCSCFAKADEWNFFTIAVGKRGTPYTRASYTIDLTTGDVNQGPWQNTPASESFTKTKLSNGWWRLAVSVKVDSTSTDFQFEMGMSPTNQFNTGMPGDGTSGIYMWGAQIEEGFPTSYIPTSGAAVDRSADLVTADLTNIIPDQYTIITKPFGCASGKEDLSIYGYPHVQDVKIYPLYTPQGQINTVAKINDDFWRWRVLGSSFALANFTTDGQVTVDWGDGIVEVLTTAEHTFTNGGGYHEIGFRLDSGTYFAPKLKNDVIMQDNVLSTGPAPESMTLDSGNNFYGCSNLTAVDGTLIAINTISGLYQSCTSLKSMPWIDTSSVTNFNTAWNGCTNLTSFPLIDTSLGTTFSSTWQNCNNLTSFPAINTSSGTTFNSAWSGCSNLTSFPPIGTSSGENFNSTWRDCTNLTSFPLLDTSSGTSFSSTWNGCTGLTSFPLIDTSSSTNFKSAWQGCSSLTSFPLIDISQSDPTKFTSVWTNCSGLTSFPLIDTSLIVNFTSNWSGCSGLTSFPLLDTSSVTTFSGAWQNCTNLTSFPLLDTSSGTTFNSAWSGCSNLTSFPLIDTSSGKNFTTAWYLCSGLTSFPLIDTSSGENFNQAWQGCSNLTSFPLLDTSSGTSFNTAWRDCTNLTGAFPFIDTSLGTTFSSTWRNCSNLTSFPLLDTSSGENFQQAWQSCTGLTSFPLLDTSSGTNFLKAWYQCSNLTGAFPAINTSSGTTFNSAWSGCSNLTSFPFIDTSLGIDFSTAWQGCTGLTGTFPAIDTSSGTNFTGTWSNCTELTSFPLIDTSSGTTFNSAWSGCSNLTSFPAGFFDSWSPSNVVAKCFYNTWNGCNSLPPASVSNILDSLAVAGVAAPTGTGTNDKKITIDWDGTGDPATDSAAAITTLKGLNWRIYLNNVLQ